MKLVRHLLALAAVVSLLAACERAPESSPTPVESAPSGSLSIRREVRPSILIEAKAGQLRAPMVVRKDAEASGGECVIGPEGPDHKEISVGGDVTYRLAVAEPGEYVLWLRAKWCCGCGNSLGVALDGAELGTVEDSVFGKWHWVRLQKKLPALEAGEHLLVITNREDGAGFDQILLTQDSDYRPTEIEPLDAPGRTSGLAARTEANP